MVGRYCHYVMYGGTMLEREQIRDWTDDKGNRIIGAPDVPGKAAAVFFQANNCTLRFAEGINWDVVVMFKGDNATVTVGEWTQAMGSMEVGTNSAIHIGNRLNISGVSRIVTDDGATVRIGDNCLFAENVSVRAFDHHPIYDLETRQRINYARDITVGSDVWLGYGVTVAGGATIGHGSIVGTMSIVTAAHPIGEHCLAVGTPAVVKRTKVAWAKPGVPPSPTMADDAHIGCLERLRSAEANHGAQDD